MCIPRARMIGEALYTNSDVARSLQSGIIQVNFDVDWDGTKKDGEQAIGRPAAD
jgi:hypothetical protein